MTDKDYITDCILDYGYGNTNVELVGDTYMCKLNMSINNVAGIDIMGATVTNKEEQISSNTTSNLLGTYNWIDSELYGFYQTIDELVDSLNTNLNNGFNISFSTNNPRTRKVVLSKDTNENVVIGNSPGNNLLLDILGFDRSIRGTTWDTTIDLVAQYNPSIYPINNLYVNISPFNDYLLYNNSTTGYVNSHSTFNIPISKAGEVQVYENYQNQKKCLRRTTSSISNLKVSFCDIYGNSCQLNYPWTIRIRLYCKL